MIKAAGKSQYSGLASYLHFRALGLMREETGKPKNKVYQEISELVAAQGNQGTLTEYGEELNKPTKGDYRNTICYTIISFFSVNFMTGKKKPKVQTECLGHSDVVRSCICVTC